MGKLTYQKECEWCGKAFIAQKLSTKYCSHTCSSRAYKAGRRVKIMKEFELSNPIPPEKTVTANLDVMTPRQASLYLGLGKTTVYRYINLGYLKAMKLHGKTLIRRSDIDSMFVENPVPIESAPAPRPSLKQEEKGQDDYYTSRQIMDVLGMSAGGVWLLVRREKVKSVQYHGMTYYDKEAIDRIAKKRNEDPYPDITEWYSTPEIIEKYDMTPTAVYSMAYDYGIPRKKVKSVIYYSKVHVDAVKTKTIADDAVSVLSGYYSVKEIMEKYNFTRDKVYDVLRRYNVPRIKVGKIVKIPRHDFDQIFEFPTKNV